ncbi:MAG: glycosyltransferase [Acidimicrobiales bacterium]
MSATGAAPRVGVVVLNHQGGDLTVRCLRSVLATDWPAAALQVVLVDNGSTDGVAARTRAELPRVAVVETGRNLGFAGGCNVGIEAVGAVEHVALLNNDATVAPGWLRPLVAALEDDPAVGAACPPILFDGAFVEVTVRSPAAVRGLGDRRPLGVAVGGARVDGEDAGRRLQLVRGFWGVEHGGPGRAPFQWTDGDALLRVPARADRSAPVAALRLWAPEARSVVLASGAERVAARLGPEPAWVDVPLGEPAVDVVNNVGSVLLRGGYGADRGFLERDEGRYGRCEEVFAWCGAAVALSRRYLDAVGTFDERYFLYYEDFDLSWRGRAQGWRYVYVPGPPVRHVHSASAVEGSRLHQHYSERNRLLTLTRNAPAGMATAAAAHHLLVTASYARRDVLYPVAHRRPPSWETVGRRTRAFGSYLAAMPAALVQRRGLRRRQQVPDGELLAWAVPTPGSGPG